MGKNTESKGENGWASVVSMFTAGVVMLCMHTEADMMQARASICIEYRIVN